MPHPAKSSAGKDGGNIVERLTGPYSNFPPELYAQRRSFYEALVQFCENRAHPINSQPTVSKQPVDLFKLYHAVKERGGFEAVSFLLHLLAFLLTNKYGHLSGALRLTYCFPLVFLSRRSRAGIFSVQSEFLSLF